MIERFDAVVAGHICLDVIPDLSATPAGRFQTLFAPGRLLEAGPATFCTGGAVANTGLSLTKLGTKTSLMGKIGDDLFGQAVQNIIAGFGARLVDGMVVDETVDTSYTVIISPPGMDRIFLHCPGANDSFGANNVRYDAVAQARLFHFGYPPVMKRMFADDGNEVEEVFRRVKKLGVTTSLDMALPDPTSAAGRVDWVTILRNVLPYVDICLPSVEETLFMLRRETFDRFSQAAADGGIISLITPALLTEMSGNLLEKGAKLVGFKLGERGFYLRTASQAQIEALGAACPPNVALWADREVWAPCFAVDVMGTTGAGDATIAGFLSAFLRGMSPRRPLQWPWRSVRAMSKLRMH